ncbi:diphosphomevalonate decarboxylase [Nocardia abscessus]|uniref:diphosphomevalonate decarboxylase n=1 Tax=Nocardia abscessus TaxID=120957 RepID=UPI0018940A5A|nr:diphosphomevalonate decarboxylase [Nocardia abscessus]MBF6340919.1 diphosphomevalonate decarboxylase [Nocardia abscessus]
MTDPAIPPENGTRYTPTTFAPDAATVLAVDGIDLLGHDPNLFRGNEIGEEAAAVAHPNIALVKYWGKRDESFFLPVTGSLSMTLDIYPTTTTVRLIDGPADVVVLNGCRATGPAHARVERFLDLVRARAQRAEHALVVSTNTGPTGAGLASSASGFAALAAAASACYGLGGDVRALSRLARRGSGSACRSIFGGFAVWHAGDGSGEAGDLSSYAEPIDGDALDPALVVAVVDTASKAVSSRDAMRRTRATSPLYRAWAESSAADLDEMRKAIARLDLPAVGEIAERNALGMHATMLAAKPSIRYLSPGSVAILDRVLALRDDGVAAYATIDAGPNVTVLCARADAQRVDAALRDVGDFVETHTAHLGPGAAVVRGGDR